MSRKKTIVNPRQQKTTGKKGVRTESGKKVKNGWDVVWKDAVNDPDLNDY